MIHPKEAGTYILIENEWQHIEKAFDAPTLHQITGKLKPNSGAADFIYEIAKASGYTIRHVWQDEKVIIQTCDPLHSDMLTVFKAERDTGKPIKTYLYGEHLTRSYRPTIYPIGRRFTKWFSIGTTGAEKPAQLLLDRCEKYAEVHNHKQQEFTKVYGLPTEQWNDGRMPKDCRRDAFIHTYALRNPQPRTQWANRLQIELPTNDDIFTSDSWHIEHQIRFQITGNIMYGRLFVPDPTCNDLSKGKYIKVEVHFNKYNEVEKILDTWGDDRINDTESLALLEFSDQ